MNIIYLNVHVHVEQPISLGVCVCVFVLEDIVIDDAPSPREMSLMLTVVSRGLGLHSALRRPVGLGMSLRLTLLWR